MPKSPQALLAERNSPAFPMYGVRECEDRHGAERDDEGRDPALGHQEAVGHTSREPEEDGDENARRDGDDHQGHPQGDDPRIGDLPHLFASFEYIGQDFAGDMANIAV